MTQEKLEEILDKHIKWLNEEEGGECADLFGADLVGANLSGADLRAVNFIGVDLSGADLSGVDLSGAKLCDASLFDANLNGAGLRNADLKGIDLRCADLRGVNFIGANLTGADLRYANLNAAKLNHANLTDAVYTETRLNLQCPEEDSFTAWKKLKDNKVAKLLIPEDAKRSSATSRKCRASKAIVIAIYNEYGVEISKGRSSHNAGFIYQVGETVYPDSWDEDRWNECSNGIHFFMTRKEAEEY